MATTNARMFQRADTSANATTNNPTFAESEFFHETDTNKFLIGDGVTAYTGFADKDKFQTPNMIFSAAVVTSTPSAGHVLVYNSTSSRYENRSLTVSDLSGGSAYFVLAGTSGGQTANGGTNASDDLKLVSTAHATKGEILFGASGNSRYDEVNNDWVLGGTSTDGRRLRVTKDSADTVVKIDSTTSGKASLFLDGFETNTNMTTASGGSNVQLTNASATDGNYSAIKGIDSGGATLAAINFVNVSHTNNEGDIAFLARPSGGILTEYMRLDSTGSLGVGTVSPTSQLHVLKDQNALTKFTIDNNTSGTGAGTQVELLANAGAGSLYALSSTYTSSGALQADSFVVQSNSTSSGGLILSAGGSNNMSFYTNGSEHMEINAIGQIVKVTSAITNRSSVAGIAGTAADENAFEIGEGYLNLSRNNSSEAQQIRFNKNGSLHSGIKTNAAGFNIFGSDGDSDVTVDTSGNVGIGTTSPSAGAIGGKVLHLQHSGATASVRVDRSDAAVAGTISISSGNSNNSIFSTGTKDLAFYTNSTENARLDSSGNFVVGSSSADGRRFRVTKDSADMDVKFDTTTSGKVITFIQGYNTNTNLAATSGGADLVLTNLSGTDNNFTTIKNVDSGGSTLGMIAFVNASHANNEGEMAFFTRPSGGSITERMRIDSSGNLSIKALNKIITNSGAGGNNYIVASTGGANPDMDIYTAGLKRASFTYGGQFLAPSGSAGSPAVAGVADTDTGMYFLTENELGFSTGGTTALTIDSNQQLSLAGHFRRSANASITASTTQTQGNGALTSDVNRVSTVANDNDVVTLPAASAGRKVIVYNEGANTLQIFPASGDDLGTGLNSSIKLVPGGKAVFTAYNSTNWMDLLRGPVHIRTGSSGVTPGVDGDDFFIESSGSAGMTIGAGTASNSSIFFADSGDADAGGIIYDHLNDLMRVRASGIDLMYLDGSGVGIGESSPITSARLHVKSSGDSGVTSLASPGIFVETGTSAGLTIGSSTTGSGYVYFADSGSNQIGYLRYSHSDNAMIFQANNSEVARMDSSGHLLVGTTDNTPYNNSTSAGTGTSIGPNGQIWNHADNGDLGTWNRTGSDGSVFLINRDGSTVATVSVSSGTVTWGTFCGGHNSQFADKSQPEIERGTVMDSIDELVEWKTVKWDQEVTETRQLEDGTTEEVIVTVPKQADYYGPEVVGAVFTDDDGNKKTVHQKQADQLPKCEQSGTYGSKMVYGTFSHYDENGTPIIHGLGQTVVRVTGPIEAGDLLMSNGDGTACKWVESYGYAAILGKCRQGSPSAAKSDVNLLAYSSFSS